MNGPGGKLIVCIVCGSPKTPDQFYAGQGRTCKQCNNSRSRARRKADPIRYRATRDAWEKRNKNHAIVRRKNRLKRRYSISIERVDEMLKEQGGVCPICKTPLISPLIHPDDEEGGTRAVVDHSHRDGHVRGILCSACNTGMGQFNDDPALLKAAYYYLVNDNRIRNKLSPQGG